MVIRKAVFPTHPGKLAHPVIPLGCAAVRQILLHDTLSGQLRALEPRDPGRVGIYACGPTVYARIHVGNARPYVVFSLLKRFLVHEGYEVTLVVNITDINDKIYAAARDNPLTSTELATAMIEAYVADTERARGRPARSRAAGERDDRVHHRADRGARGIGSCLSRRRRRLLLRRFVPALRSALAPARRGARSRRRRGGRRAQARRRRLCPVEGVQARRGQLLGFAVGSWAPGMAHRVFGDGGDAARSGFRNPWRRQRPDLPAPRKRGRADRGGTPHSARTALGAQRNGQPRPREDGEVRREHLLAARGDRRLRP